MKAILEFDLDDYSDKLAHKRAVSATDAYLVLHDLDNELRSMLKYDMDIGVGKKIALPEGMHTITEHEANLLYEVVCGIKIKLNKILEDRGVNMGDLE